MSKKILFLSTSLLTATVASTAIVLNFQDNQAIDDKLEAFNIAKNQEMNQSFDLKESQKYFFDYIKWLNDQNEDPIAILNVSASLPYQEALFIAMVNQFNGSKNELTMIQEEKFRQSPRYDINKLLAKDDSPFNVLNEDKDQPATIVNSIKKDKVNVLFDQRNPNALIPQSKDRIDEEHIAPILNYLIEHAKTKTNKINIVIPDIFFMQLFNDFSPSAKDPLIQLISKAKSILLTTDGNAHIVKVVESGLLKFVLSPEFKRQSEETIKENLKAIQNLDDSKIKKLTKNDIYNLLLLEEKIDGKFDFIHLVHYDSSYSNNLFTDKTDQNGNFIELLDEKNKWKVSSVSLNVLDYAKLLNDQSKKSEFIKLFDEAFFVDDKSELFVSLDKNNFDPKKKTAIFIGSSLFSPQTKNHEITSLEEFANLREYVQKSFNQFLEKYPQDEYNIVFKHHPIYSAKDSVKLTQIYTNNKIEIPNVINSKIPFEYLLSSELAKAERGEESILFFKNNKQEIEPKFKLFGFQATTSLIHTTRLFLETSLKISHEEIEKVISFDDFLIPTLFDVIEKPFFDPKKYNKFDSNKMKIENTYRFFNPSQWNSEIDTKNDRFLFNELKPLGNDESIINDAMINILLIGFVLIVISSILTVPTTIYMIRKTRKNKNQFNLFLK